MQIRRDAYKVGGGDVMQLEKTKEYLERLGVEADVSVELQPDLSAYDLVHLYNLTVADDTLAQCQNAKKQGKPIVLSSIYWTKDEYLLNNPNWKVKAAKFLGGERLARFLMKKRKYYNPDWHKQRKILEMADLILATSRAEIELIERDFDVKLKNYRVVPPGVEAEIFTAASAEDFTKKYGLKNFVLSVGRFEYLKNQLSLIKALGGGENKLVLIGQANPKFSEYYDLCREMAAKYDNIIFLPPMTQAELASAYAAAKVHATSSWSETFGLVSLEAAAAGTNVVTTIHSPLKEYFGELMFYCDPAEPGSVKRAIKSAIVSPTRPELKKLVLEKFSWQKAAEEILAAYREGLNLS